MLEGKCPKCGSRYYGWALATSKYRYCLNCKVRLKVTDNSKTYTRVELSTSEKDGPKTDLAQDTTYGACPDGAELLLRQLVIHNHINKNDGRRVLPWFLQQQTHLRKEQVVKYVTIIG